ncbi:MAG: hypothetical protein K6F59_00650, partial [Gammaproteobacteria bacterium]|nr:hypothetical protein [Gammaproteobacteria bacterium]
IKHPDSGIAIKGFNIPDWKEVITITSELMKLEFNNKDIGWDLAHTDKGWIVVEGNANGMFVGPQIVYERGMKYELDQILERC